MDYFSSLALLTMDWNNLVSPQFSKRQSACLQRVEEECVLWPNIARVPPCECMKQDWESLTDYMPVSEGLTQMLSSGCVKVCEHVHTILRQLSVWGAWKSMIMLGECYLYKVILQFFKHIKSGTKSSLNWKKTLCFYIYLINSNNK